MDLVAFGEFLRSRRTRIRPADVAVRAGARRRVPGLRRDEVARLAGISSDYYADLEQGRGVRPSERILAGLARALRLSAVERDALFALAGRPAPPEGGSAHVQPALLGLLDRLADSPALVLTDLNEVLVQNALSVALVGDHTDARGPLRSLTYQWFTEPDGRAIFPAEDHPAVSRTLVRDLRRAAARASAGRRARWLAARLCERSEQFAQLWLRTEAAAGLDDRVRFVHPALGVIELDRASFYSADLQQQLLWFTAPPGGPAADQLAMLNVIGLQELRPGPS
jgi:transcriptional regulator with XRE-family HTH domain